MKPIMNTLLTAFALLTISCKKESAALQSSGIDESLTQVLSSEANELAAGRAIRIGTQVWMIRNLDVTHYRNGDRILQVQDPDKWEVLTTGAWCWYNNDSANCAIYGKLYNWYAVNDRRGLAPEGWHIPSYEEWDILADFLGGYLVAGGKMKSTGTIQDGTGLWNVPNTDATNSSGFTGLPGGFRSYYGGFFHINSFGYWWSSRRQGTAYAWFRYLINNGGYLGWEDDLRRNGYSVRCLRD